MTFRIHASALVFLLTMTACSSTDDAATTSAVPVTSPAATTTAFASTTAAQPPASAGEPATTTPGTTSAVTTAPQEPLPPYERDDLVAIFDPLVEPLGYRVTRASLFNRTTFEVTAEGAHLALYVAPLSDISDDQFARDFPSLVKVFLPLVFDRWPDLTSFDVCQEPFDSAEETPPSLTLIDLGREAAAGVAWESLDLAGLIELHEITGIGVWANLGVRESATWQDAAGA